LRPDAKVGRRSTLPEADSLCRRQQVGIPHQQPTAVGLSTEHRQGMAGAQRFPAATRRDDAHRQQAHGEGQIPRHLHFPHVALETIRCALSRPRSPAANASRPFIGALPATKNSTSSDIRARTASTSPSAVASCQCWMRARILCSSVFTDCPNCSLTRFQQYGSVRVDSPLKSRISTEMWNLLVRSSNDGIHSCQCDLVCGQRQQRLNDCAVIWCAGAQ
jgi:hypothetical protein